MRGGVTENALVSDQVQKLKGPFVVDILDPVVAYFLAYSGGMSTNDVRQYHFTDKLGAIDFDNYSFTNSQGGNF